MPERSVPHASRYRRRESGSVSATSRVRSRATERLRASVACRAGSPVENGRPPEPAVRRSLHGLVGDAPRRNPSLADGHPLAGRDRHAGGIPQLLRRRRQRVARRRHACRRPIQRPRPVRQWPLLERHRLFRFRNARIPAGCGRARGDRAAVRDRDHRAPGAAPRTPLPARCRSPMPAWSIPRITASSIPIAIPAGRAP